MLQGFFKIGYIGRPVLELCVVWNTRTGSKQAVGIISPEGLVGLGVNLIEGQNFV